MTVFLCIRHGETAAVGHQLVGRAGGVALTARGREQAEELVTRLEGRRIDRIVSSPMERARETAAPLARSRGVDVQLDDGLLEIDFGAWTGCAYDELRNDPTWAAYHTFRSGVRIPGGELAPEIQARMVAVTERLRGQYPDEAVVLVGHGDPIRYLMAFYAGVPLDMALRLAIDVASVSILAVDDQGAHILSVNHTGAIPAY